jgi:hypothetical protein
LETNPTGGITIYPKRIGLGLDEPIQRSIRLGDFPFLAEIALSARSVE